MKLIAKLLTGIGVLVGLGYLCCRGVGEKLHLCRKDPDLPISGRLCPIGGGQDSGGSISPGGPGKILRFAIFLTSRSGFPPRFFAAPGSFAPAVRDNKGTFPPASVQKTEMLSREIP